MYSIAPSFRRSSIYAYATVALSAAGAVSCADGGGNGSPVAPAPNLAPVASGAIPPLTMTEGETATVDVASYFNDPDGDVLTYTVATAAATVAAVAVSGSTMTIVGVAQGTATATVTARDPGGLETAQSFSVMVAATGGPVAGSNYIRLDELTITSTGAVKLAFLPAINGCVTFAKIEINGKQYTVHWSEWQRSTGSGWNSVPGTRKDSGFCAYDLTNAAAGEYRLAGELSVDSIRNHYRSANTVTVR